MSVRIRLQLLLVLVGTSACLCQHAFSLLETTALTIDSPAAGASYSNGQSFDYHATATSEIGVTALALEAGGSNGIGLQLLNVCKATGTDGGVDGTVVQTTLTCDFTFVVDSHPDLVAGGVLTLKAVAINTQQEATSKTITVQIKPLTCQFTAPPITAGTSPAEALVASPSALTVSTTTGVSYASVVVTADDDATTLADWTDAGPYTQIEPWIPVLGLGTHNLLATCTDTSGDIASDKLTVLVRICTMDSDCPSGQRCCSNDGTCNAVVEEGADCDCDNPCPSNQGCFPGICGATPEKCFPGCNPGSNTGAGQLPQSCPNQGDQQAFCNPLPTDQVTAQNMGGACIVGDGCNVVTQNCPMFPLDRSQPEGPNNPLVTYNCLPVAPNLTGCFPAGSKGSGQVNCLQQCGAVATGAAGVQANCAQGYECVQSVDQNGSPLGPPACENQCSDPSESESFSNQCPGGDEICVDVYEPYGQYMDFFTTGSCCIPPGTSCTISAECCDDSCVDGTCR